MIVPNPLPFAAALWSRIAEISVTAAYSALAFLAAQYFEELTDRANGLDEDCCTSGSIYLSAKLEDWRTSAVRPDLQIRRQDQWLFWPNSFTSISHWFCSAHFRNIQNIAQQGPIPALLF